MVVFVESLILWYCVNMKIFMVVELFMNVRLRLCVMIMGIFVGICF